MNKFRLQFFVTVALCCCFSMVGWAESDDAFDDFDDEFAEKEEVEVYDPLEGYNRFMHNQNERLYFFVMRPVAKGYESIVPKSGRVGVEHFFKNLLFPIRFVNNALQLKFKPASIECGRFLYNTTVGMLGFTDPALEDFEWMPYDEDFGQTLAFWGMPDGAPLVLPFFGPSNCRDLFGKVPDYFLTPVNYVNPWYASTGIKVYDKTNYLSLNYSKLDSFHKDALDSYSFFRHAYEQMRTKKIEE